jgi:hypothetical protein
VRTPRHGARPALEVILGRNGFTFVGTEKCDGPFQFIAQTVDLIGRERLRSSTVANVLGHYQERGEVVCRAFICHPLIVEAEWARAS